MATIVLAHGAWSAAWAWKKMRPLMAAAGHAFFVPTYTGLGERAHLASPDNDLETHIGDVLGVLTFEDLRDVVLIGHSYGGMVATGVAGRASERIAQLVYLDAFVPDDGESLADFWPEAERRRRMEALHAGDGWRIAPNPVPPDTSAEDAAWVAEFRLPQSVKCFEQPLRLHTKLTMPRSYIQCMRYAERGPFGLFAARAKADGWPVYELDASHSPNVTAPQALMAVLQEILSP
ncbi:MAG: alpha/beta hydrolase [Xanthobacteraceae bacterium]